MEQVIFVNRRFIAIYKMDAITNNLIIINVLGKINLSKGDQQLILFTPILTTFSSHYETYIFHKHKHPYLSLYPVRTFA